MHEGGQWDQEMLPPQELYGDIKRTEYNYLFSGYSLQPKICISAFYINTLR